MCNPTTNAKSALTKGRQKDPTGTGKIRRSWIAEMNRRWDKVKGRVYRAINNDDIFGLRENIPTVLQDPPPKAFQFKNDAEKVEGFMLWLQEMVDQDILEVQYNEEGRVIGGGECHHTYIDSAFQKGMRDGNIALEKAGLVATEIADPFNTIDVAFQRAVPANRVALLYTRSFRELKGITDTTDQVLSRTLAQGMAEGRGPQYIARQISKNIKDIGMVRARTLARTETIRAHHKANVMMFREAGVEGVTVKAEWATAGAGVCFDCAWMNGRIFTIDEIESLIPLHPNCVSVETSVLAPDKLSAFVTSYTGIVFNVRFADGTRLTVTPNHMLLTPYGFIRVKDLHQGDNVLHCPDFNRVVPSGPDDDRNPFRIDNVIKAFAETSGVSPRSVEASPEYLHGDAVGSNGHIDVVWSDGLLTDDGIDPLFMEQRDKLLFDSTTVLGSLLSEGSLAKFLYRTAFASDRSMGRFRESLASFNALSPHSDDVGFTGSPELNALFFQDPVDRTSGYTKSLGECVDAFPGLVELNEVVSIETDFVVGCPMYDLHCVSTMYIANSILSSNCRCVALPAAIGEDPETRGEFDLDSVGAEYRRKDGSYRFRNFYKQKTGNDKPPPRSVDRN